MNRNSNYFFYVYSPIIDWSSFVSKIKNLIKNIISFNNIKCPITTKEALHEL